MLGSCHLVPSARVAMINGAWGFGKKLIDGRGPLSLPRISGTLGELGTTSYKFLYTVSLSFLSYIRSDY